MSAFLLRAVIFLKGPFLKNHKLEILSPTIIYESSTDGASKYSSLHSKFHTADIII